MPQLQHNHLSICYKTFGKRDHPCLIFISGLNGQLINWPCEMMQDLADRGLYIIIFDNRDVGLSTYYDHLPSPTIAEALTIKQQGNDFDPPYTLQDMASDVITLLDGLKIKQAHVAGISMGGIISQILALNYPERILSLICIATTSGDAHLPAAKPEVLKFFFLPREPEENVDVYVDHMMHLYHVYHHPTHINEQAARRMYMQSYQRAHHPEGFKRQLLALLSAKPRGRQLKKIRIPSLIIHGDYDPVFPVEHGYHLAECLPNSRLEIIENLGHGLPEPVYEKFIEHICKHMNKT